MYIDPTICVCPKNNVMMLFSLKISKQQDFQGLRSG